MSIYQVDEIFQISDQDNMVCLQWLNVGTFHLGFLSLEKVICLARSYRPMQTFWSCGIINQHMYFMVQYFTLIVWNNHAGVNSGHFCCMFTCLLFKLLTYWDIIKFQGALMFLVFAIWKMCKIKPKQNQTTGWLNIYMNI